MRVLVVGAGRVGSAFVKIASRRGAFEHIVVADVDHRRADRAAATAARNRRGRRVTATALDASSHQAVAELARDCEVDVVLNACPPRINAPIFEGAFAAGVNYVDMAMHLSVPHPERPYDEVGMLLGQEQLAASTQWEERGQLAIVGMGVEPGFSDIVARYANDHLFSRIDEIGVRDGADLVVDGYDYAPTYSVWTTIEECLNPPIVFERDRGWFTTAPFSEPEVFSFPEGIGPLSCVNVEHEEVVLIPRWLDVGRVTFKYGLGREVIDALRTLHELGLDGSEPVEGDGATVSPREVVAAALPDPASLGKDLRGKTCAGSWVRGAGLDGEPRSIYLYHVVDNAWSVREFGHQAVVWQTAVMPAVAIEMLATGVWSGAGVLGPEAFHADPFLELLDEHGVEWEWDDWPAPVPSPW